MSLTLRQRIVELLKVQPMSSYGLARELKSSEKSIEQHLEHVAKTIGASMKIHPSQCDHCHFEFRKRDRLTTPSRCPMCKSERIQPPFFSIVLNT